MIPPGAQATPPRSCDWYLRPSPWFAYRPLRGVFVCFNLLCWTCWWKSPAESTAAGPAPTPSSPNRFIIHYWRAAASAAAGPANKSIKTQHASNRFITRLVGKHQHISIFLFVSARSLGIFWPHNQIPENAGRCGMHSDRFTLMTFQFSNFRLVGVVFLAPTTGDRRFGSDHRTMECFSCRP